MPTKEEVAKRKQNLRSAYKMRREHREKEREQKREEKKGKFVKAVELTGGHKDEKGNWVAGGRFSKDQIKRMGATARQTKTGAIAFDEKEVTTIAARKSLKQRLTPKAFQKEYTPEELHQAAMQAASQELTKKQAAEAAKETYHEKVKSETIGSAKRQARAQAVRDTRSEQRSKIQRLRRAGGRAGGQFSALGENWMTNLGMYTPPGAMPPPRKGGGGQEGGFSPLGRGGPYDLGWGVGLPSDGGGGVDLTSLGAPPVKGKTERHPLDFTTLGPAGRRGGRHPLDFTLAAPAPMRKGKKKTSSFPLDDIKLPW